MKKTILTLAAVAFIASLATSCKKDYTCTCTVGTEEYVYELKDVKKKDANDACDAAGSLWILAGGSCAID